MRVLVFGLLLVTMGCVGPGAKVRTGATWENGTWQADNEQGNSKAYGFNVGNQGDRDMLALSAKKTNFKARA